MKNVITILMCACLSMAIVSCKEDKKSDEAYDEYKAYVIKHNENPDQYYDSKWDEMENEYKEKRAKAEANMDAWSAERKAEYESTKLNWEVFKENHTAEATKRNVMEGTKMIVKSVLPDGINEDMSNVTNENILAVHKHFVSNVNGMKDNLTREQWDFVEILWERLDTRKNELEKDMKAGTKLAIAEEKIEYAAIKATNRPVAKSEENTNAKENK